MTSRLLTLAGHDARLQYRYGIYAAYAFVVAFYVILLTWGGPYLPLWIVGVIVYSDPAAVGFFFLGALMMLERNERVRVALATTPLSAWEYFASKAATLGTLALIACAILLVISHQAAGAPLLLLAVALTSLCYLGIGVPIALRFRTVNAYLIGSGGLLMPVILPAGLAFLDPMPIWLALLPPVAQLRLMLVATGYASATALEIGVMLAVAAVAAITAAACAIAVLRRELGK